MTVHVLRKPWQVMLSVLYALSIRHFQKRFITTVNSDRSIAALWLLIEPMAHVFAWLLISRLIHRFIPPGIAFEVFILTGAVSYLLFRQCIGPSAGLIKQNLPLYVFRQVKPIDGVIAHVFSELLISIAVFIILMSTFWWLGISWRIYELTTVFLALFSYAMFLFGISLLLSVACFFVSFLRHIITLSSRLLYFFSGVFFSASMLPEPVRNILLYSPVFQFIELLRESMLIPNTFIPYGSLAYLAKVGFVTLVFGVALYLSLYRRMMMAIYER